jgi:UDP-MurNAc hydroxylase
MFPDLRSKQDYIEEFSRFALHIGARYAIPFASNHCFLHRETRHFNGTAVAPDDVQSYYRQLAARTGVNSDCVVMAPGSSWSDVEGFKIVPFDYSKREQYIESLLARRQEALVMQYEKEDLALADFESIRTYFLAMMRSIPWLIRQWLKIRIVLQTKDAHGEHNWLLDFVAGRVEAISAVGDYPVIESPALVLNDCANIRMFSAWTPSKRLRIRLSARQQLRPVVTFLFLLDLYELDIFPLRKNLSWRAIAARARRWREFVEMGRMFVKHIVLRRPVNIAALYALPEAQGL